MEKEDKYFLIDICGTLYQSNTTFDFIRYFFSEKPWYIRLNGLRKNKLFRFCNTKAFEYFYNEYLVTVINRPVIDIIEAKRKEGIRLILVSATLDVIAKEVSERLGIPDVFSSHLSYDKQNVCLGRLKIDLLGNKANCLKSSNILEPYYGTITDNYSDLELILKSENSYVVVTDKQYQNKWEYLLKNNRYNHSFVLV